MDYRGGQCGIPCASNPNEICGGDGYMEVYRFGDQDKAICNDDGSCPFER